MSRLPEVFGKKLKIPENTPDTTHIGICGKCGGETKTLFQWGRKWLCNLCYNVNIAKVKPDHA